MAKHIVRYLLEGDGTVPKFIEDGGHFPIGEEYVGISIDDEKRHLPSSVQKLNDQQLIDRIISLGYNNPEQIANTFKTKL